jgi:diguanylate cyclase (GGDEF)-like protein
MQYFTSRLTWNISGGLFLCLVTWWGLFMVPTASNVFLALACVIVFLIQLDRGVSHRARDAVRAATLFTMSTFPDAVFLAKADGSIVHCNKSTDFSRALSIEVPGGLYFIREDLFVLMGLVLESRKEAHLKITLEDNRVIEVRGTPYKRDKVLFVMRDITSDHRAAEATLYLATHDSLTGLLNRSSFNASIDAAVIRFGLSKKSFGLVYLDLDHFKEVNDTRGHDGGDLVLKQVGQRLRAELRGTDKVFRLGGDEFTILIEDLDSLAHMELIAKKIGRSLALPYFEDQDSPKVTASIGFAVYPVSAQNASELITKADLAMYRAKARGRNAVSFADSDLSAEIKQLST